MKACVLATKLHMLSFCEACGAITQDTKRFSVLSKKKSKAQNNDFQKVVISNLISDALRDFSRFYLI